jgi:hypothetical protein
MLGVVKEVPVPRLDPPVLAAYQFKVPVLADAPKTIVPVPQRFAGVVEVIEGVGLIVADTDVLAEVQPPFVASTK